MIHTIGPLLAFINDLFNKSTLQIILVSAIGKQILHENFNSEEIKRFADKNMDIMDKIDIICIVNGLSSELNRQIDWPICPLTYAMNLFDK